MVDLKASPPRLTQTLKVGRQPSGIAISRDGQLALVANRDSKSVTMLKIDGATISVGDTVATEDSIGAIAITPDGSRAIATKTAAHKVVLMKISPDRKLTIDASLWAGLFPWNVAISPDGELALVNNIGNNGQSDGGAKTISVIDLSAAVPFVSEQLGVGDAPEGITFSPNGAYAAVTILQGSYDAPETAWFRHDAGAVSLLKIEKSKVSVVNSVDVGAFPEGVAFAPDNQHLYVGNFHSNSISILTIDASGASRRHRTDHKTFRTAGIAAHRISITTRQQQGVKIMSKKVKTDHLSFAAESAMPKIELDIRRRLLLAGMAGRGLRVFFQATTGAERVARANKRFAKWYHP